MENNYCRECRHYHQHYILTQRKILRIYCGHCTLQKAKRRLPDAAACVQFEIAPPDEDAFAQKEYLSKELLQYLLNLELLPPIGDEQGK